MTTSNRAARVQAKKTGTEPSQAGSKLTLKMSTMARHVSEDTQLVRKDSDFGLMGGSGESFIYDVRGAGGLGIQPPYEPSLLQRIPQINNTLLQCIEAMEVNIDGTGHEFVPIDSESDIDETELLAATQFFDEPFPDMSFISIRRQLRRDLESTGCGYMEVLTALDGSVLGLRPLNPRFTRLGALSPLTQISRPIMRNGKEIMMQYAGRERCFLYQPRQDERVYFNEFGNTQQLNKQTGVWAADVPIGDRAGYLIRFKVNDDVFTDYGVPRWINQLPSVLGSRKAEELNLELFDAGGVPSAVVFVKGGTIASSATEELKRHMSGQGSRGRVAVVEATSTSGTIDNAGGVDIKVERFGSGQGEDALYAKYDTSCEEHVRLAFRLPPLFIGKSQDYNYATASVSYQVAEAQVFKPERDDFDDVINRSIIKALGFKTLKFKSKPITIKDIITQLKAVEMLIPVVDPNEVVNEVNNLTGINLPYKEGTKFMLAKNNIFGGAANMKPLDATATGDQSGDGTVDPNATDASASNETPTATANSETTATGQSDTSGKGGGKGTSSKKDSGVSILNLVSFAKEYGQAMGIIPCDVDYTPEQVAKMGQELHMFTPAQKQAVNSILSIYTFGKDDTGVDLVGGCCSQH